MSTWQEVKLKEICKFKYGSNLPANSRIEGNYPVYGSSSIVSHHIDYYVKGPGIIVGRKGTVGKVQYSPTDFFPIDTTFYIEHNLNKVDLKFLYYRLQISGLDTMNSDAAVPGLNRIAAINQRIDLPPLLAQQKIAKILSNYDDLIENNLKCIKLLEESARLTYEEWFLRFRIDGKKLEIDPESDLPFGWGFAKLGDFLKFKKGKKADEIFEEKKDNLIKLLLLKGLGSGEYAYVEKARHVIARRGDVLMTMDGARSSVVFYSEDGAVGSTMSLVETGKLPKSYIYHYFKSTYKWLEINNTGAAIPHANKSFINKMKIIHPGDEMFSKWSKKISHINDQVFNLKDQNQLLKEARAILLPRLMIGMIDTDDMDIAV